MTIKELRKKAAMTQKELADYFQMPLRTLENYESGNRQPPEWVANLMKEKLEKYIESKKGEQKGEQN